jgi:hypothetical protein
VTKECAGCGKRFKAGSNRAKWCPACKILAVRAAEAKSNAKRARGGPESRQETPEPLPGYKMSRDERRKLVAARPHLPVAELARLTGAGVRTVKRDRAELGLSDGRRK